MRWAALIVALSVLAGGCGDGAEPAGSPPPADVVTFTADDVSQIAVAAGGHEWRIDERRWDRLTPLVTGRELDAVEPLATYGLDPPRAVLRYLLADGATVEVPIGSATFDGAGRYALRPGTHELVVVLAVDVEPVLEPPG